MLLGGDAFIQSSPTGENTIRQRGIAPTVLTSHTDSIEDLGARTWVTIEGLPSTSVTAVTQDAQGFIWAGTYVGLLRTDGRNIEAFRPERHDPGSLAGATVNRNALITSRDGSLWIGTSKGVCRRRPTTTAFECVREYPVSRETHSGPQLNSSADSAVSTQPQARARPPVPQTQTAGEVEVHALTEGMDGTIWAGSQRDLFHIDSASMTAYREKVPVNGRILSLAVSPDGALWVGTEHGLFVRESPSGPLTPVHATRPSAGSQDPFSQAWIRSLVVSASGEVWIAAPGAGLYRIEPVSAPRSRWASSRARRIDFVAGLPRPLAAYPPNTGPSQTLGLAEDEYGRLWIATWGAGVFCYDPATGRTAHFESRLGDPETLPSDEVVGVWASRDGGVWAATWDGLAYLAPAPPYRLLAHDPSRPSSLSDDRVTSLLEDDSGSLWVGTFGGGLNHCDPITFECRRFRASPSEPGSLCHDIILDLDRAPDGSLWISTSGGGVCRYDPVTGIFVQVLPPELQLAHVYTLAFIEGRVWLGTAMRGLVSVALPSRVPPSPRGSDPLIDLRDASPVQHLDIPQVYSLGFYEFEARTHEDSTVEVPETVTSSPIDRGVTDSEGLVLVGTLGNGLCFGKPGGAFSCLNENTDTTGARSPNARVAISRITPSMEPSGAVETATPRTPSASVQLSPEDESTSLSDWVVSISPSATGAWIGTIDGLYRLSTGTAGSRVAVGNARPDGDGMATDRSENHNLAPPQIEKIASRSPPTLSVQPVFDGRTSDTPQMVCSLETTEGLWATTLGGIYLLDPTSHTIRASLASRGFPDRNFLRNACLQTRSGLMAIGSQRGVFLFDPVSALEGPEAPTLITSILVDGHPVQPTIPAHLLSTLTLHPDQGGPTFEFATLNYPALEQRKYTYRLEGVDADWSRPTEQSRVAYPKLSPGRYAFQVRAAYEVGDEVSVALLVLAPVWQRPWFIALALIFFGAVITGLYRTRVRYLMEVERTRRSIADDLHDDIGSKLGGLALSLDLSARTAQDGMREDLLERAEEARELASDLRDTVWIVDAEYDTVGELVERTADTAGRLLPTGRVEAEARGRSNWPVPMSVRRHLFLLCKEAVHNAARHGSPTLIRIESVVSESGMLSLSIADNGIGFEVATSTRQDGVTGRGLSTLRSRAAAIRGELQIESVPSSHLGDPSESDGLNPDRGVENTFTKGTRITLRIRLPLPSHWRPSGL